MLFRSSQQPLMQWEVGNDVKKRGLRNYSYSDNPAEFGRFYLYEKAEKQLRVVVEHIADPYGRAGAQVLASQPGVHIDHRQLDQVGGRALHGGVDGGALRHLAAAHVG